MNVGLAALVRVHFGRPGLPRRVQARRGANRTDGPGGIAAPSLMAEALEFAGARRHRFSAWHRHFGAQAGGVSPRRLAMILSTIRFGSTPVIRCRIGSGVIW